MNLPTKLTILRMILVPVYALVFYYTPFKGLSLILFLVAALTDSLDGYLARKWHQVTDFGKFLDPLADKLLTLSAFVLFSSMGWLSPLITLIIIGREITISVFRAVAASKNRVIAASVYGKAKTVLQMGSILLIHSYLIIGRPIDLIYWVVILSMTAVTLLSGIDYLYQNRDVLRES